MRSVNHIIKLFRGCKGLVKGTVLLFAVLFYTKKVMADASSSVEIRLLTMPRLARSDGKEVAKISLPDFKSATKGDLQIEYTYLVSYETSIDEDAIRMNPEKIGLTELSCEIPASPEGEALNEAIRHRQNNRKKLSERKCECSKKHVTDQLDCAIVAYKETFRKEKICQIKTHKETYSGKIRHGKWVGQTKAEYPNICGMSFEVTIELKKDSTDFGEIILNRKFLAKVKRVLLPNFPIQLENFCKEKKQNATYKEFDEAISVADCDRVLLTP